MENLWSFINAFESYLLVFLIFLVVAFIGIRIGIILRKNKDAKTAAINSTDA